MNSNSNTGKNGTGMITGTAAIAAVYVLLTLIFMPVSFGLIQVRLSEALCVLTVFMPEAVAGLTAGCFISNIIGSGTVPDIVFGTLATYIGAKISRVLYLRLLASGSGKSTSAQTDNAAESKAAKDTAIPERLIAVLPTIISNTVILPFVFRYAYGMKEGIWIMAGSILLGETLSAGAVGSVLYTVLNKKRFLLADINKYSGE